MKLEHLPPFLVTLYRDRGVEPWRFEVGVRGRFKVGVGAEEFDRGFEASI